MKLRILYSIVVLSSCVLLFEKCREPEPLPENQYDERLSGGTNTVFDNTSKAFGHEFPALTSYDLQVFELGDKQFESSFVTEPAPINGGLGPLYNNTSCSSCHHNDGIGVPTAGDLHSSLLVRISMPGTDEHGGPSPVPGYGTQLQDKAAFGKVPEGKVVINYDYQTCSFSDGETYELRSPTYTLTNLYMPISGYEISPRLAPPVFGMGLLEAIPEDDILKYADPDDINKDGISGRSNYVWNPVTQSIELGRFGWKANVSSILEQVSLAYNQDIGVTNKYFPQDASYGQPQADNLNDDPELSDDILNAVKFYVQTLAVPARRNVTDPSVLRGKQFFEKANCQGCHVETMTTATDVAFPQLSHQVIHPYTDLLLHDLGDGLADNRPDYKANGKEWRTAPLWGIGLYAAVNYPAYYLHDGRARSLVEAIMWHGGEAEKSKEFFENLSKSDRDDLLNFLKSL